MSDEQEVIDPFAPQAAGLKTKFFMLKLYAQPVALKTGASYAVKEIHDKEGNVKNWNGKSITKGSKTFHVILHARAEDKDGNEYEMTKDHLTNDKAYVDIIHPSLMKLFGSSAEFPTKGYVPVKAEEVPTGESYVAKNGEKAGETITKTTWRIVSKYASQAKMKEAEKAHFSRFSNGNGATEEAPADENAAPDWLVKLKPKLDKLRKAGKSDAEIGEQYDATAEQVAAVLA